MNTVKKIFKKKLYILLSIALFFTLASVMITNFFIIPKTNLYASSFNSDIEIVITKEELKTIKENDSKLVDMDIDKVFDDIKIEEGSNNYQISLHQGLINSKANAKRVFKSILKDNSIDNNIDIYTIDNVNIYLVLLISFLISFSVSFLLLFLIKPKFLDYEYKYDNENIFNTPFHKEYWKGQTKWLKKVKDLVIISALFALILLAKLIVLPSGFGTLGISITYLIFSIIALVYGPITGLVIGIFSDVFGHFLFEPSVAFHVGYTLNAMLAGATYGIFFYKTHINFTKVLCSRIIVNLFVNVILGSIWYAQFMNYNYDMFKVYLFTISLPKNLVYLLPQSIVLYLVIKAVVPVLKGASLISEDIEVGYALKNIEELNSNT